MAEVYVKVKVAERTMDTARFHEAGVPFFLVSDHGKIGNSRKNPSWIHSTTEVGYPNYILGFPSI
jgi:hypothetical protein